MTTFGIWPTALALPRKDVRRRPLSCCRRLIRLAAIPCAKSRRQSIARVSSGHLLVAPRERARPFFGSTGPLSLRVGCLAHRAHHNGIPRACCSRTIRGFLAMGMALRWTSSSPPARLLRSVSAFPTTATVGRACPLSHLLHRHPLTAAGRESLEQCYRTSVTGPPIRCQTWHMAMTSFRPQPPVKP